MTSVSLENLGTVNKNRVDIGSVSIWFSYQTPVAFRFMGVTVVRKNDWSTTTGKFLNELEADKSKRIPSDQFVAQLETLLTSVVLS